MSLLQQNYTSEDYWALPEGRRAELIDGELWDLASPSRAHQEIVHELDRCIGNHIKDHNGPCKVYPAPFAVNLFADDSTPMMHVYPFSDAVLSEVLGGLSVDFSQIVADM